MNQQKKPIKVLGIMSGTSLDGVDLCLAEFSFNQSWEYSIVAAETVAYNQHWVNTLLQCESCKAEDLVMNHSLYGVYLGELVNQFLVDCNTSVDLIASHGHTIFHQPDLGFTFQLGNGANIASTTGIKTISDFRTTDVALGGQGAPLVPIGDKYLFSDYQACVNIGGILNISIMSKNLELAFDVSPANLVLNHLYQREFPISENAFDHNGNYSRSGTLIQDLFQELNKISYFRSGPPKSIGKEWINKQVFPIIEKFYDYNPTSSILFTYSKHIASQLKRVLKEYNVRENILVTGGGAYNSFLIDCFRSEGIQLNKPSDEIIEFKEALIFGFLGLLRVQEIPNTLRSVTGASSNSCGGVVFLP